MNYKKAHAPSSLFKMKIIKDCPNSPSIVDWVFLLLLAVFIISFSYLSTSEHMGLKSNMNDLGGIDQALYQTTKGNFLYNSSFFIAEGQTNPTFLAKHAFFTLLFFVPIYMLYPEPSILLVIQTILIALGAIPLYLMGKGFFPKHRWASLVIPFAYLTNPIVHDTALNDFHGTIIAMPMFIIAFYFLYKQSWGKFAIFSLLLLLTKEDLPLTVAFFGLYMLFVQKHKALGVVTATLALLYFIFITDHFMPTIAGVKDLPLVSGRYSYLGENGFEIIKTALTKPFLIISVIFTKMRVLYLILLGLPLLYLPIISPEALIITIPSLAVNVLSSNPFMHYPFEYYYSAIVIAGFLIATLFSLKKIYNSKNLRKYFPLFTQAVVVFSLLYFYFFSPAPFTFFSSWDEFRVTDHAKNITAIKEIVGSNSSLSIQNNLGPHFSQRLKIYTFPYASDFADYVVLDITDPNPKIRTFPRRRRFNVNIAIRFEDYHDSVAKVFEDENYGVHHYNDGYLVFKKGYERNNNENVKALFDQRFSEITNKYDGIATTGNL